MMQRSIRAGRNWSAVSNIEMREISEIALNERTIGNSIKTQLRYLITAFKRSEFHPSITVNMFLINQLLIELSNQLLIELNTLNYPADDVEAYGNTRKVLGMWAAATDNTYTLPPQAKSLPGDAVLVSFTYLVSYHIW